MHAVQYTIFEKNKSLFNEKYRLLFTSALPAEGEVLPLDTTVYVTMMGKFTIYGAGLVRPRVISLNGRSKRLWTLVAYLILNRERGVPAEELIELFWHDNGGANPMSTLQNNISRTRNALEDLGMLGGKRLIHNNCGTYYWAPDRKTVVDIEEFQAAAKEALACRTTIVGTHLAVKAAQLYTGDFLPECESDGWCMGMAAHHRDTFLDVCRLGSKWLVDDRRFQDAIVLCRRGLEMDPAMEQLHVLTMRALIQSGEPEKAVEYYYETETMFRETYGSPAPEEMQTELVDAQRCITGTVETERLAEFLKPGRRDAGAFRCEPNVFREIVNRYLRDLPRSTTPCQVLTFRVEHRGVEPVDRTLYMLQLDRVLKYALRGGDPYTRTGEDLFMVLLPGASKENGETVKQRVLDRLAREYPESNPRFVIRIVDLVELKEEEERRQLL